MSKEFLINNLIVICDDKYYDYLNKFKWSILPNTEKIKKKYAMTRIRINGKPKWFSMATIVMGFKTQRGKHIDHINGNSLDNRESNLRYCTRSQNNSNRSGSSKKQYKGVFKLNNGKFKAQLYYNKKYLYLGTFSNPLDAAKEYDLASIKYHGIYGKRNFS